MRCQSYSNHITRHWLHTEYNYQKSIYTIVPSKKYIVLPYMQKLFESKSEQNLIEASNWIK